jgi:hypothetical protein
MSGVSGVSFHYTPYMSVRLRTYTRICCFGMGTAATCATVATAGGLHGV